MILQYIIAISSNVAGSVLRSRKRKRTKFQHWNFLHSESAVEYGQTALGIPCSGIDRPALRDINRPVYCGRCSVAVAVSIAA